jgi:hypothetical protein
MRSPGNVVGGGVARQLEDHDVAALRLPGKDASLKGNDAPGESVAAVAVGDLRDEEIVADEQGRLHRARWDVEGLKEEDADNRRQDQRLGDNLGCLAPRAFARFSCYIGHDRISDAEI